MDVAVVRFCILFEKKKLERARTGGGCDNGLFYFDVFSPRLPESARTRSRTCDSKQTHTQVVVKLKRFEPTVACRLADRPNASLVSGSRLLMKGGAEGGNIGHSSDGLVTAIKRAMGQWRDGF